MLQPKQELRSFQQFPITELNEINDKNEETKF